MQNVTVMLASRPSSNWTSWQEYLPLHTWLFPWPSIAVIRPIRTLSFITACNSRFLKVIYSVCCPLFSSSKIVRVVPPAASTSTQATSATTAVSGAVLTAASEITRVVLPAARRCRGRTKGTNKSLNTKLSAKRKKCRDDSVIDSTICYLCMCDEPAKKLMRGAIIEWTGCSGNCERWFHDVCIANIGATVQDYTCNHC